MSFILDDQGKKLLKELSIKHNKDKMGISIILEPINENTIFVGGLPNLDDIINIYSNIRTITCHLESQGWETKLTQEDSSFYVICNHPNKSDITDTKVFLNYLSSVLGIDVEEYVTFVEDDGDCELPDYGGDVLVDDYEADEDIELAEDDFELMHEDLAEWLSGRTIESVDIVEDYRIIFHLDNGKKLIYDEDDYGFFIK